MKKNTKNFFRSLLITLSLSLGAAGIFVSAANTYATEISNFQISPSTGWSNYPVTKVKGDNSPVYVRIGSSDGATCTRTVGCSGYTFIEDLTLNSSGYYTPYVTLHRGIDYAVKNGVYGSTFSSVGLSFCTTYSYRGDSITGLWSADSNNSSLTIAN